MKKTWMQESTGTPEGIANGLYPTRVLIFPSSLSGIIESRAEAMIVPCARRGAT